jgi:hypothetical protein
VNNEALVTQEGNNNAMCLHQWGNNLGAEVYQGGNDRALVVQTERGATVVPGVMGFRCR